MNLNFSEYWPFLLSIYVVLLSTVTLNLSNSKLKFIWLWRKPFLKGQASENKNAGSN